MSVMTFHIINSIKGGAGKSWLSLLLAHHLSNEKTTYIIDLDLQGSSWEENYSSFFETKGGKYINDLMYSFEISTLEESQRNINIESMPEEGVLPEGNKIEYKLPVFIASPRVERIDDIQVDLFESAVYRIIRYIRDTHPGKDVHIVFDMPPSKDRHAEQILTHLLLDINSPLYKEYEYEIQLYMIANITRSHVNKNINYLKSLARDMSFSDILPSLIENEKFKLFFILNDLNGLLSPKDKSENVLSNLKNVSTGGVINIPFTNQKETRLFAKLGLLKHVNCEFKKQMYVQMCDGDYGKVGNKLIIDKHTNITLKELIDKIK